MNLGAHPQHHQQHQQHEGVDDVGEHVVEPAIDQKRKDPNEHGGHYPEQLLTIALGEVEYAGMLF